MRLVEPIERSTRSCVRPLQCVRTQKGNAEPRDDLSDASGAKRVEWIVYAVSFVPGSCEQQQIRTVMSTLVHHLGDVYRVDLRYALQIDQELIGFCRLQRF